jgi:hypothetical protein
MEALYFHSLYVLPRACKHFFHLTHLTDGPRRSVCFNYLRASYNKKTADAYCEYLRRSTPPDSEWCDPVPTPVEFTVLKAYRARRKRSEYAPLSFWAVIDLQNGEPTVEDGKLYVFAFKTRKEAREFRAEKVHRGERVPQPVLLYQHC